MERACEQAVEGINMLKQITEKEALEMYIEGTDVKILAPMVNNPDWLKYEAGLLSRLLDGIIYLTDEEEEKEVVFEEPIAIPEPEEEEQEPEPDPEPRANKFGKLNLDEGKIAALHRAGWTNEKIADEMHTTGVTIGKRLKAMKERGDL